MTTERQVAANRRNARLSTGPRTGEGKAIVAGNATRHGLLSAKALVEGEDEALLVEFGKRMRAELRPVGELEELLVDRIVSSSWRLRRLLAVEAGVFEEELQPLFSESPTVGLAFIRDGNQGDSFSKLSRYEAGVDRGLYRALHELQRLQAERHGGTAPLPAVLDVDVSGDAALC